ncbi:hypothetical protein AMJ57_01245 [Parcubacteria bacterium SG8_24]|nr:MAG: hypothetical protein AMJ57_01245 [Parcubacteria bacterium SG8_24]
MTGSLKKAPWATLPDVHDLSTCWNPHRHGAPFRQESADRLLRRLRQEYSDDPLRRWKRVAPLCVFGGVRHSPHVLHEHASGTYAVCPVCQRTMVCNYGAAGLEPRSCDSCGHDLDLNDYFQPILPGSLTAEEELVDPYRDPAVAVAEACALAPRGIPHPRLHAVVAILSAEGLLRSGHHVSDLAERRTYPKTVWSRSIHHRLTGWPSPWVVLDTETPGPEVTVTEPGELLLKARGIKPALPAILRLKRLLGMDLELLQSLAIDCLTRARTREP